MEIEDQRKLFANKDRTAKQQLEGYIHAVCDIIRNIVSDAKLVKYFILLLDGMIEGSFRQCYIGRRQRQTGDPDGAAEVDQDEQGGHNRPAQAVLC